MQIAGHEDPKYFGLAELYRVCEIAREITMQDRWKVGRVIARPYVGEKKGEFKRTSNRHDLALKPPIKTVLNYLKEAGLSVISIGKINDIFVGEGITKAIHSTSSMEGMNQCIEVVQNEAFEGLCFVNLVDFDALYGHRRDPIGYGEEIQRFDEKLGTLLSLMKDDDLLMLTADHGNDPTFSGTDHTREQVPLLVYHKGIRGGMGTEQESFGVIGASVAENFSISLSDDLLGKSLYKDFS